MHSLDLTWLRVSCCCARVCVERSCKFDLRYIVLVRSFQPLELYVCKVFWIRFSNNKYTLSPDSLDVYETHFTVMNYGRSLRQVGYEAFVPAIEAQYPGTSRGERCVGMGLCVSVAHSPPERWAACARILIVVLPSQG